MKHSITEMVWRLVRGIGYLGAWCTRIGAGEYRVRFLAYAKAEASSTLTDNKLPQDLTQVASVLLMERIRADAAETLRYFAAQGVVVKIMSGDHSTTVAGVASQVGLAVAAPAVDARELPTAAADLVAVMEASSVFGRVSPPQKPSMVAALQARGHVVAMVGDGVNDILGLKQANIGIAMGEGSNAARAVAQLVLLDNQFATLPAVVDEGRRVIGNVERLANLFVTKSIYAMLLAFAVGVADMAFPLLPRHLTLVGALTIGIPAFRHSSVAATKRRLGASRFCRVRAALRRTRRRAGDRGYVCYLFDHGCVHRDWLGTGPYRCRYHLVRRDTVCADNPGVSA